VLRLISDFCENFCVEEVDFGALLEVYDALFSVIFLIFICVVFGSEVTFEFSIVGSFGGEVRRCVFVEGGIWSGVFGEWWLV